MRILVIRFSAMGDVALTVPVIAGMRRLYPDAEIVFLTRKVFHPFFSSIRGMPLFAPDLNYRHKGFGGIFRLFADIQQQYKPDIIVDLHDVIRSRILDLLFRINGAKVYVINKGRSEKKALVRGKKKIFLKHTVQRYADVFSKAGFQIVPEAESVFRPTVESLNQTEPLMLPGYLNIGVAPYTKHKLKMWPEEYMTKLLELISSGRKCRFFLFGGSEDMAKAEMLQSRFPGAINVIGKYSLDSELAIMSRLDLMIAMDSSNMHMAALAGIKVISIWGGTDPMAGFGPWMQPDSFSIRIPAEELDCRPCTIYGKGETRRDFQCMKKLTPEIVYKRMTTLKVI
ncbi:MAG TPA: glycosyltransferase family 9 protein [Bacteroidales bacterium]|nr:glycosyltransferase family 9 protein [Bacteroidales bacterium]